MAMKRDYERVAAAVRSVALELHFDEQSLTPSQVLQHTVNALADAFERERSAFDKGRFIRACQVVK